MRSLVALALERLRERTGADAAVVLGADPSGRRVIACAPHGAARDGEVWPRDLAGDAAGAGITTDPAAIALLLPVAFRLALPRTPGAVLRLAVDSETDVIAAWASAPPDSTNATFLAAVEADLAPLLGGLAGRRRAETDVARLEAVIAALDQAVIFADHRGGSGRVNVAAAWLLGVEGPDVPAETLAQAMRGLWARAEDAGGIERRAREILSRPDASIRDWTWSFSAPVLHLRVTTVPVAGIEHSGRLWVLDDITTEVVAAERYRILAENASDVVVRLDADRRITWASPSARATLGLAPEELVGQPAAAFVHPDDLDRLRADATASDEEARSHATVRFRRADGSHLWVDFMSTRLTDGAGGTTRIVGLRDVDGEVRARELLAQREAALAEAQRIARAGNWAWDPRTDQSVWSDEMLRIYGLAPDSNPPGLELHRRLLPPADFELLDASVARALSEGTPYQIEYDVVRLDGTRRRVAAAGEAVFDEGGAIISLRGTAIDITERHAIRKELEQTTASLTDAQRIAGVGSWTWDLLTGAWTWSAQLYAITGDDPGAGPPTLASVTVHLAADDQVRFRAQLERVIAGGERHPHEYDVIRSDGEVRRCVVMAEAIHGSGDRVVGVRGTVADITDEHERREARARRLARRADYLARAQHTLRTNLSVVEGWAEIVEDAGDTMDPTARANAMAAIGRNARALSRHLRGLMDEAAEAARADAMTLEPVDAAAVAKAVVADYEGLPGSAQVSATAQAGVEVLGSSDALDTAIRHLVENATRHAGPGGSVEVSVAPAADAAGRVDVIVTDDGPGLPEGLDVFAAFVKGESSSGSGLGLHVVRTLVEAMGGSVDATNRADRPGAAFRITLRTADAA